MDIGMQINICRAAMLIAAIAIAFCTWYIPVLESKLREKKDKRIEELIAGNEKLTQSNQSHHSKIYNYQSDLTQKDLELKKLDQEYQELKKITEPNKLAFNSKTVSKNENKIVVSLQFKPSKNQRLGTLIFVAALPDNSKEKILNFWPTTNGGAFESGPDSKKISLDGKQARLAYSLLGSGYPSIDLTLSGPTDITISGNNGLEPVTLKIE
jgi:lipopolysaccharide export LptBFGC system permease protein LptF